MWDYTEKYPVLLEEKGSDGTIVRYTYAGNRERAYADVTKNSENEKAQVYSLYTDRLGSTRWALDENAEVAAKTEYDAWGKPETETVSSKLKGINISKSYTGYVYDETTGYWNAGARMYNSTDREFIQKDPKAGNVYETLTQNGYIYCGDNPLYYIDPDGCSYISTLGNAGRTAFNVVKSGVAGGLGFYTRICCEIDNMPTWAKAAVGTTGIVVAGVSGVGAAAIAEAVIASAGISAATDGAFYSIYALNNGSFSKSELKDTVINGAANGYMFAGAGLGVAGIRNAAKSGKLAGVMADEAGSVKFDGGSWKKSGKYSGTGEYGDVGGHHVHAKAGFKDDVNYDPKKGFSISQNFMRDNGLDHNIMTSKQRELFKELYESGRPNTLEEHTRIAREALKAGGASDSMIDDLINASLRNLREQGVTAPTRIPWYSK